MREIEAVNEEEAVQALTHYLRHLGANGDLVLAIYPLDESDVVQAFRWALGQGDPSIG
jgi:hypothetical protein